MLFRVSFVLISLIILAIIFNSFWLQPPMVIARDNKSKYVQIKINSTQDMEPLSDDSEVDEPEPIESLEEQKKVEDAEPLKKFIETPLEIIQPDPPLIIKKPADKNPYVEPIKNTPAVTAKTISAPQMASSPDNQIFDDLAIEYKLQLSAWLQKYKRYPLIAKKRHYEGLVRVKFSIDHQGHLLKYEITEPSRHTSLNDAVVKMLKRASPMPEIPKALHNLVGIYEYEVPILFELKGSR